MSGWHGRHAPTTECDICVAREEAARNPPKCWCCKGLLLDEGSDDEISRGECVACVKAECGEKTIGTPCLVFGGEVSK